MAKFAVELPTEILKDFEKIHGNAEKIFGGMTKAGAQVVLKNIKANVPPSLKKSQIMACLKMTQTYETPSDGGINTKVGFFGYFTNEDGRETPAPLVCNVFEYGRSNAPFPKQPFLRKSFKKTQIEKAMLEAQVKLSGGLLDE